MLPQYNVAQKVIEASGIFNEETLSPLRHYLRDELKNYNKITTGEIKASETILKAPLFA